MRSGKIATSEYVCFVVTMGMLWVAGCLRHHSLTLSDVDRPMVIAVAPALNHSGSSDFDPIRVADLMASELSHQPGVTVIPVNRVLAQLEVGGERRIDSPAHALTVMDRVGADGIVVFAVTEYDPYPPAVVGLTAQLYGHGVGSEVFDPIETPRRSKGQQAPQDNGMPRAQYQRVFNARDDQVIREVKRFAKRRNSEDSPYGWRKYLASQENYLRFCCHLTGRELIRQEVTHVLAQRVRQSEVEMQ